MGQMRAEISEPENIKAAHDVTQFQCGEPALDDWLRRRAFDNEERGASRTYVICQGDRVVGYYSLAAGSVEHATATGRIRRNMPDPIPVIVLGRLAVDLSLQGQGVGTALLKHAVLKTLQAAQITGIRAILVHAISIPAKQFYQLLGFSPSPSEPMTLMIPLSEAAKLIAYR